MVASNDSFVGNRVPHEPQAASSLYCPKLVTCYCASLHGVLHINEVTVVLIWKIYYGSGVYSSNLQIDLSSLRMKNYYIKWKMLTWLLLRISSARGWETVRDFCSALPLPLCLPSFVLMSTQFTCFSFCQYQLHQHFACATLVSTISVPQVASHLKCLGYSHTHCSATHGSHRSRFSKVESLCLCRKG